MEQYAREYERKHCGRVTVITDYSFKFEEFDPKHPLEVKRTYWVMKSYFFEPKGC